MNSLDFNTEWRKVAAAVYHKPVDSKIFGSVELDVTELEQYITQKRQEGLKITLTHILLLAIARAFRDEVPEFNCYIRRGSVVPRDQISASLSVLIHRDTQMGSVLVNQADQLNLRQLSTFLETEIAHSRKGKEHKTMQLKSILAAIPWPFRGWILGFLKRISIDWGFYMPALGISPNNFGSFVLSNIGSVGLDMGFPALLPSSNVSVVLVMGSVNTKPGVVNGQVVPRRIMNLGAALDHRVVDAMHGGKLFRYIKRIIRNPEVLE